MSEKKNIAIQLSGVKKMYKLGQIGGGTLQGDLQSWWARVRHKEDPNLKIGQEQRQVGQTFFALNGIDLTIYQGEAVGIIGSNGAGKSTMLKLLSRVTAPTAGEIDIYGRIASMLEVGTGFHGEMTGRENVYMNGAILGMSKAEIDAKMEDIIEFSEVREFIDTPVKRYSSGMYVKLAFSVAAHLDSEIMIMDEVLAVGDMAFQKKCLNKMRDAAKKEGRTVLYVSHNMNTIRQLCDRCIVLNQGRVVFEGDVEEAIEVYLGIKMNSNTDIDLCDLSRDPEFTPHPVTMTKLQLVSHESPFIQVGEKIRLRLSLNSKKDIKEMFVRLMIKTSEGQPVTMSTCDTPFSIGANIEQTMEIIVDTTRIVPGRYTISPVVYEVDEFGVNVSLDGLKEVLCFEVTVKPGFNHNMPWQPRYWGHYYGDSLIVSKLNKENDNG